MIKGNEMMLRQMHKNEKTSDLVFRIITLLLLSVTTLSALVLTNVTSVAHADDASVSTATVTVNQSCSMTAITDTP
ncbi:hypothetical protein J5868_01660, partial [Candidatus Saccharibacteria bacterium]|nr:hypothetical protein [Candidatus Saccharibacteria bacterium]